MFKPVRSLIDFSKAEIYFKYENLPLVLNMKDSPFLKKNSLKNLLLIFVSELGNNEYGYVAKPLSDDELNLFENYFYSVKDIFGEHYWYIKIKMSPRLRFWVEERFNDDENNIPNICLDSKFPETDLEESLSKIII